MKNAAGSASLSNAGFDHMIPRQTIFSLCRTYRATDPKDMKAADDPVGLENDEHLRTFAAQSGVIVAAWGANGTYRGRDAEVRRLLPDLHCLQLTKGGHPGHPLYLLKTLTPVPMGSNVQIDGRPQLGVPSDMGLWKEM